MLCSGECTMHAIVTSIGGKADPPLIRGMGLIFERTVRPAGTLPLRDLATHRRADAGPARNSPHNQKGCPKFPAICKSYLPKPHVRRQSRPLRTCACASSRLELLLIGGWDTRWPRESRWFCLWHEHQDSYDSHETHRCHAQQASRIAKSLRNNPRD